MQRNRTNTNDTPRTHCGRREAGLTAITLGATLMTAFPAFAQCGYYQIEPWDDGTTGGWTSLIMHNTMAAPPQGGAYGGYLEVESKEIAPGFHLVYFESGAGNSTVTGDYISARVNRITLACRLGSGTLDHLTIHFSPSIMSGYEWSYELIPANNLPSSNWRDWHVDFDPAWSDAEAIAAGWIPVDGAQSFRDVMANVRQIYIYADSLVPFTVDIDRLRVHSQPQNFRSDNGGPDEWMSHDISTRTYATRFVLSEPTEMRCARIAIRADWPDPEFADPIRWTLYTERNGLPDKVVVDHLIDFWDPESTTVGFDNHSSGGNSYNVWFSLWLPLTLAADRPYWFALDLPPWAPFGNVEWHASYGSSEVTSKEPGGSWATPVFGPGLDLSLFGDRICLGDANRDQMINVSDLLVLLSEWGECYGDDPLICSADMNGDGRINVTDLLALLGAWGVCN